MKAFSQRLKTLRKTAGLTLKQLATRIEVSEAYISMLESGKRQPARPLVQRLATELGGADSFLLDELLILAGYSPENLQRFETPQDPLADFQRQLLTAPEDFLLFQGYVQTLIKTGRSAEALAQIEQGFSRFRNAFQLQCLLADLELARGNLPAASVAQCAALEQFRGAGLHDERLQSLLIANLGGICFQLGMQQLNQGERVEAQTCFAEAELHFRTALQLDPDNLFSRDEYARVCFNLADLETGPAAAPYWQSSLEAFSLVLAADPKPGLSESMIRESSAFWAYAQAKCGQFSQARQLLQLMASLHPSDWFPRYLLAAVHVLEFRQNRLPQSLSAAAACLVRSLALNQTQTLATSASDPDLDPLRQHHPELFIPVTSQTTETNGTKELEA